MQDLSDELDSVVAMMMLRLQRFSDRTIDKSPRRFALGLPEVTRRTRQLRVKCLIIAPDMCEAADKNSLDDRVRQVLGFAYKNDIHVIFALSRAGLGRAVGKSMHISIVGVLDATGAMDLFDAAVEIAEKNRQSWLLRYEQTPFAAGPYSGVGATASLGAPEASLGNEPGRLAVTSAQAREEPRGRAHASSEWAARGERKQVAADAERSSGKSSGKRGQRGAGFQT
jgi:ribosomal protein L7Ae-like RNA K-turn-binding protein